jgi:phosphoribosylanthranilate isomerase
LSSVRIYFRPLARNSPVVCGRIPEQLMRTWIKFCGTTSLADALAAAEAEADALGFIFAPSRRRVTPEQASAIVRELPDSIERVGVFVNESAERILAIVDQVGLTAVQLHGDETPTLIFALRDHVEVIKTILVSHNFDHQLGEFCGTHECADSILLDSGSGSGKAFDWVSVRPKLNGLRSRFIIAGGLKPDNVGQAVAAFSPWGVDAVTGVESEPGRKDHAKLKSFVAAVRKAEQT